VMHRAVLLTPEAEIGPDSLELGATAEPQATFPVSAAAEHDMVQPPQAAASVSALVGRRMEDVEQALILETLSHCLGNRTHAATILGISIRALRNKLRDYAAQGANIPPPHAGVAA
jgi:DNA-binding NtrC family response regulator